MKDLEDGAIIEHSKLGITAKVITEKGRKVAEFPNGFKCPLKELNNIWIQKKQNLMSGGML